MSLQRIIPICAIIVLAACSAKEEKKEIAELHFKQYSESVKDSFYIDVQLPKEYAANPDKKYPTLVFVDGNFYFPMMSAILHQYETAGLLEPFIVVGVGYQSFKTMDSLRIRDYLFPKALPSDELNASGGGPNFYNYISKELLPKIDSDFRTDTADRTLLGHSFGGYFVLYSLLHQATQQKTDFNYFVSASPSLWYNNFYLSSLPDQLSNNEKKVGLYMSVGALEDSTWSVNPVKRITQELKNKKLKAFDFISSVYSHLDHMDVPLITFTKGLQELRASK